jgi:hypothetical protein
MRSVDSLELKRREQDSPMRLSHTLPCCCLTVVFAIVACSGSNLPPGQDAGGEANVSKDGAVKGDGATVKDAHTDGRQAGDARSCEQCDSGPDGSSADAESGPTCSSTPPTGYFGDASVTAPGGATCASATGVAIDSYAAHIDLLANTAGGSHDVDAPCAGGDAGAGGAEVFYAFGIDHRTFVYADTFGASWDTVLFLLDATCTPITSSTMQGDALCNDDACGSKQSQVVAVLEPGNYVLGLAGQGAAQGAATIHFEYALAGSGTLSALPQGTSTQSGTTSGTSDITDINSSCLAAGPENSYWWATCPSAPCGSLVASTCGGATWETDLEVEIPQSVPYSCSRDSCSLQTTVHATIPAGPGLRVLVVDGETATDKGAYTMQVQRP